MTYSKFSVMSKMNDIFAKFNEIRCFLLSPKKKTYAKNSFILHFILTVLMLLKICLILNYSRCLEGSVPPVKLAPIYNFYSSLPHVKISQLLLRIFKSLHYGSFIYYERRNFPKN